MRGTSQGATRGIDMEPFFPDEEHALHIEDLSVFVNRKVGLPKIWGTLPD